MSDLYSFIIEKGNPYFAYSQSLINLKELINYLVTVKDKYHYLEVFPSITLILKNFGNDDLYINGHHLLGHYNDDPLLKYYFLKGGADIPIHKNKTNSTTLKEQLINKTPSIEDLILADSLQEQDLIQYIYENTSLDSELIKTVFLCNNSCCLQLNASQDQNIIQMIIQTDNLSQLQNVVLSAEIINLIVDRLESLPSNKYKTCLVSQYFKIIFDDPKNIQLFDDDKVEQILSIFASHLGIQHLLDDIKQIPYSYCRFFFYPQSYQMYILGVNLLEVLPNEKQMIEIYKKFINLGVDDYIKYILDKSSLLEFEGTNINPHDTMMENPENYLPFDRIDYVDNQKIYRFTRTEFSMMVKTGINMWTNKKLPYHILYSMATRLAVAETLKLPPSAPLEELFERALVGELVSLDICVSINS